MAGQRMKVNHRTVVHEPQSRRDDAAGRSQEVGQSQAAAPAVHLRHMRRVRQTGKAEGDLYRNPPVVDHLVPAGGPLLGHHPVQRQVSTGRISQVGIAIRECGIHGHAQEIKKTRAVGSQTGFIPESLHDVEDGDRHRAAVRRRHGRDLELAERDLDTFSRSQRVLLEVRRGF